MPLGGIGDEAHSLIFLLRLFWVMRMRKPRSDESGGLLGT
jgi:hypothetical protein